MCCPRFWARLRPTVAAATVVNQKNDADRRRNSECRRQAVVTKRKRIAAHLLEATGTDIELADGNFSVAGTDRRASITDRVRPVHLGSTARSNASWFALDGPNVPLSLGTNCRKDALTSSSIPGVKSPDRESPGVPARCKGSDHQRSLFLDQVRRATKP